MDKVTVFQDAGGEWRWHRQSENGEVVSTSGEGYVEKAHAKRMASVVNVDISPEFMIVDDAE